MLTKEEQKTPIYEHWWGWSGPKPLDKEDLNGEHDCIKKAQTGAKIPEVKVDFLRDPDGVPIVGPDGQPWFIMTYGSEPNGKG